LDEVFHAWQGLGYYSRARNILKSAKIVVDEFNGILPSDVETLKKLPGIGRYTAGAISSIAFGLKEPIVDGNVARVYARIFEREEIVNDARSQNLYYQIATDLLPDKNVSSFNQGLMELGALVCVPQNPRCDMCPVSKFCKSFANDSSDAFPIRRKAPKTELISRLVLVIKKSNTIYMTKRAQKGVYHGMWEFPGFPIEKEMLKSKELSEKVYENLKLSGKTGKKINEFSHTFTKFKETIFVYPFTLENKDIQLPGEWVNSLSVRELPMGSVQQKIFDFVFSLKE
jgi:A/G-specific adenine glycosylase